MDSALHLPSPGLLPDQEANQRLQMDSVSRALKRIDPERAEAIILCTFGGLKYAEAARLLQKSEAAIKMLVSRGLQDLRERTSLALEVER